MSKQEQRWAVVYCLRPSEGSCPSVLLGRRTRNPVQGCLVGPGGGIEDGETVQQAVIRELKEETGLDVLASDLRRVAELHLTFGHSQRPPAVVHVCLAFGTWDCPLVGNGELDGLRWYPVLDVPMGQLPPADSLWFRSVMRDPDGYRRFDIEVTNGYETAKLLAEERRPRPL